MIEAPIVDDDGDLDDEGESSASLPRMASLSTPREADIDRIVRMAQRVFKVEIAVVSMIDEASQSVASYYGPDFPEMPFDISFCACTIQQDDLFIVENATRDKRFRANPMVVGARGVCFFAGQTLFNGDGLRIGTLSILSTDPRAFSSDDADIFFDLSRMAEVVLEHRDLTDTQAALFDLAGGRGA